MADRVRITSLGALAGDPAQERGDRKSLLLLLGVVVVVYKYCSVLPFPIIVV